MTRLENVPYTGKTHSSDGRDDALRALAGQVTPGWSGGAWENQEQPMSTPTRLMIGFIAGFISVLTLQSGLIAIFYAAGATVPFPPWSMAPVPPFGVPQSLSAAFWGGLWGVAYAFLEPKLTARLGWWAGGLVFGAVLPLLVLWFVALPLKGLPVGGGFVLPMVLQAIVLHAGFGLGTAIIFQSGRRLAIRRAPLPPAALSG
jgi:hypothetical protein